MAGPHRTAHVRHRDRMLARTRRLTLWVTSGAIAVAAGLGIEFAHELPGHASPAAAARPAVTPSQQVHPGSTGHARQAAAHARRAHRHRSAHLTKPTKAPASTPAPPVVTSGGT